MFTVTNYLYVMRSLIIVVITHLVTYLLPHMTLWVVLWGQGSSWVLNSTGRLCQRKEWDLT